MTEFDHSHDDTDFDPAHPDLAHEQPPVESTDDPADTAPPRGLAEEEPLPLDIPGLDPPDKVL